MRIQAGRLRDRVELLRPTPAKDELGGPITSYAVAATRWCARVRFTPVSEDRESQRQTAAQVNLLMRLDAETAAMTTDWRLRFEGQDLQVSGLERDGANGSLIVTGQQPTE